MNSEYPDCEPNGLGELKEIKRLPAMSKHAPKIKWGDEYDNWPIEKRLKYAEGLAASMNHAADVLQKERNDLIELAESQEMKLIAQAKDQHSQHDVLQAEMTNSNAHQQGLNQIIVDIQLENKALRKEVKALQSQLDALGQQEGG